MVDLKPQAPLQTLEEVVSSEFLDAVRAISNGFCNRKPFPFAVIDNFFKPKIASFLANGINSLDDRQYRVSYRSLAQRKLQIGNVSGLVPHLFHVYELLMAPEFTDFIEQLSGYPGLRADRQFTGAGLHRYLDRGFSEIHLDSNRHPFNARLHHRVNLLIFMNPAWHSGWGGELVLWSSENGKPSRPEVTVEPVLNRAVIFSVARTSWHSVNAIRCPRERARNSMAIYYFNSNATKDDEKPRSVLWHSTRWRKQVVFEITNRVLTRAKPYARHLRWLRSNKFDGVNSRTAEGKESISTGYD